MFALLVQHKPRDCHQVGIRHLLSVIHGCAGWAKEELNESKATHCRIQVTMCLGGERVTESEMIQSDANYNQKPMSAVDGI